MSSWFFLFVCVFWGVSSRFGTSFSLLYHHDVKRSSPSGYEVTYDDRSFIIDGQRTLLLSGSVHYPRVAAEEWSRIFKVRLFVNYPPLICIPSSNKYYIHRY